MASKSRRVRLDQLLVDRALAPDSKTAAAWVMARKVRLGDQYITKPGTPVAIDAEVEISGLDRRYVGRGGEKLAAALARFRPAVGGRAVLDAGASTGGFTDCLLQRGAATVYAVDVGFGQLRGSLAADSRVVVFERTNIGSLRREQLTRPISLCVADLSYLSIKRSLPILSALFEGEPEIIHLVKPLFEGVDAANAADLAALAGMLPSLLEVGDTSGLQLCGLMASPILGSNGTVEFFGHFARPSAAAPDPAALFEAALEEAAAIENSGA